MVCCVHAKMTASGGSQISPTLSVKWTVQFGGMPARKRKASDNVFIMHRTLWSYARDRFSPRHAAPTPEVNERFAFGQAPCLMRVRGICCP
jgi:hypothetical protein